MYPASFAASAPHRPALVMAGSGDRVTYAELDDRSARLAALLHAGGLRHGDTVLLALGNDVRWGEILWACLRSGLYLAAANWHLSAAELTPLVDDSCPDAVITSTELTEALDEALEASGVPAPRFRLEVGSATSGARPVAGWNDYDTVLAGAERDPALVETVGGRLLFSSGTTGRPKPFRVHPTGQHPAETGVRSAALMRSLEFREPGPAPDADPDVLLIAGPAYHAGPLGFLQSLHQLGGTVVLMERFDPEAALAAIQRHRITHSQWVPTMFVRLLRLPEEVRTRHDLSSHRVAIHGAAPCAPEVKQAMLDWWGPIVYEYYGASEGYGRTSIGPHEWLAHPGSVGRAAGSTVHITDDEGRPRPAGESGRVWFARPDAAEPQRSAGGAADLAATPGWGTSGDLGYVDADGYLYLTGRVGHTIISGGVNVYPREIEDVLTLHPDVEDVAVIGLPDPEFGERVTAVVVPAARSEPGPELAEKIMSSCRDRLAGFKCPREVRFADELPRSDAGKIRVGALREQFTPQRTGGGKSWN